MMLRSTYSRTHKLAMTGETLRSSSLWIPICFLCLCIAGCTIKTEIQPPKIFKDGERPLEKLKERIDEKRTIPNR